MNPRYHVLECYPKAFCARLIGVDWIVYSGTKPSIQLGKARNPQTAWRVAWENIKGSV